MSSSPQMSAAVRPQSPLNPLYDSGPRYDPLQVQPTSPRALHPRTTAGKPHRHNQNAGLRLPSLPRFHPANFPSSQHTSVANTPSSGPNSPQPPLSPMQQQKMYSDAQRQLYLFQRETLAAQTGFSAAPTTTTIRANPVSPKLAPLGSPGPVTPLELEGQDGYLVAGVSASGQNDFAARSGELVEKLIEQEARRNAELARASQNSPVASQ